MTVEQPIKSPEPILKAVENECLVEIVGEQPPLIKPGRYKLAYIRHETVMLYGKAAKLVVWFRIVTFGPHFETILPRWYNVKYLVGKQGKNGRFKVGHKSDFLREYLNCFEDQFAKKGRLDRIPVSNFKGVILKGEVRTVKRNSSGHNIHNLLKYSVNSRFIGAER